MNKLTGKKVVVTGASSGIGRAIAIDLSLKGSEVYLIARRLDRLKEVEKTILELNPKGKVHLLPIDVNDPDLGKKLEEITKGRVDILINNAGLALGRDYVETSNFSDWEQMIGTNITANFKMVHMVLPWMMKNGEGDIINLCSVAGHYTYPGGAVYCATKHAVNAFTKVLREETCGKNIRVMQISPGMVNTEFSAVRFKGDSQAAQSVYAGMTPLAGEDVSRMMIFMLEQPRHVVIDEIITMPSDQGAPTTVHRRKS
ncbi:MAG: SDR family NAD(P)-dependent oxidoreductase [Bacteriovoracia bacterium]